MNRYQVVYIKPDRTHQGKGIMKAVKTSAGYTLVKLNGKTVRCSSLDELYAAVLKHSEYDRYIVQKAIPLAKINGRLFDIRSMMMRNTKNHWEFFGIYAKVSGV